MAEETPTSMPYPEAEVTMSPAITELLLPPFVCLACISGGLVLWTVIHRHKAKKTAIVINCNNPDNHLSPKHLPVITPPMNKVSPSVGGKNEPVLFLLGPQTLSKKEPSKPILVRDPKESPVVPPLFQQQDLHLIDHLTGLKAINVREVLCILMPVIFSLGFCPVTFLMNGPMVRYLWPSEKDVSPPNINDAIACFLVPAGMVYAISFGFAFQQVAGGFRETELGVREQTEQLMKLLTLVRDLTIVPTATRVAMVRILKDMTLTSLSKLLGQDDQSPMSDISQGTENLLRLLYTPKVTNAINVKDSDPWQRSVFHRLEKLLTQDDLLSTRFSKTRIHALQWVFLESLGYFTFWGMLLVHASSYRTQLTMCLITVISISLLCYLVADLDSPFHGFFRVSLHGFSRVIERMDHVFKQAVGDCLLEKSLVDL